MSSLFKKTGIVTKFLKITPKMASAFLQKNACHNRPLNKNTVKYLAGCMSRGEWRLTHQSIGFDINGTLIDGQHRLHAVIYSNKIVDFTVAYNLDPKSYNVLDQGNIRSTADILNIPKTVAEPINFIASRVFSGTKISPQQKEEIYLLFGDSAHDLVRHCKAKATYYGSASFKAAAVYSMMKNQDEKGYVLDVYEKLNTFSLEGLPKIAGSLYKYVNNKRPDSGFDKAGTFNLGMKVFDKAFANRVQLGSKPYPSESLKELKKFYLSIR